MYVHVSVYLLLSGNVPCVDWALSSIYYTVKACFEQNSMIKVARSLHLTYITSSSIHGS